MLERRPKTYQRFFAELKRRHVFRVMAVYGIVGFVILQVADLAVPALLLPEWTYRFAALLLLIGLPVALITTWAVGARWLARSRRFALRPAAALVGAFGSLAVPSGADAQAALPDREEIYRRYLDFPSLVTGGVAEPEWLPDGIRFRFREEGLNGPVVYEFDPTTGATKPSTATSAPEENGEEPEARVVGVDRYGFPMMEIRSPDGRWLAHRRDNDLWLRTPGTEDFVRLTDDGEDGFAWGEAFEWDEGYGRPWAWWAPDGSKLAIKKLDERPVPVIPMVMYGEGQPRIERIPYSGPGEPLPRRELYLVNVPDGTRIRVDDGGDPEQQILAIGWQPDGSEFLYVALDRPHKRLRLLAADASTGRVRVVLSEVRETFHDPLWSSPPRFIPLADGERFVWTSDRDGWRHIYLYDLFGRPLRRLTEGAYPVHDIVAVDDDKGWVYFTAHPDRARPYDLHLCRVRFDGSGLTRLTEAPGQHRIRLAPSMRFFVDTHSSVDRPPVTEVRRKDGRLVATIARADTRRLDSVGWVAPEEVVVRATDGVTDLYGVLYRPFNFDPTRRYPLIEYIYDGFNTTVVARGFPVSATADDAFPSDQIDPLALAQLGFVVWVVDGRGTDERGRAFLDVVYGGRFDPIPDHVAALRQLAQSRPYIDLDRVGIFGVSAGGTLTLQALLTAPETYHAGVAISAPVVPGNEVLKGPIEENPGAYQPVLLSLAERLEGRLLLIHGTDDPAVPVTKALMMVDALVEAGRPHELVLLPGQGHLFRGAGARYARAAMRRFFVEHLEPGG